MQDEYEGWTIYTTCEEARPHDWLPGRPMIYSIRGIAEYRYRDEVRPSYDDTSRIDFPPQGEPPSQFFDFNKAHEYVRATLQATIDQRNSGQ